MNETDLVVVGNIVNSPQRTRLPSGDSVTNFRMASTSRRFDRETQAWTDHRTFFVDVECWGELGGNVSHTLSKGDPVVVKGEIYTHEWDSDQGRRSRPQVRAAHVGPDLTRGVADFRRSARAVPQAEPSGEPEDAPVEDPYAARSTDYQAGEEALHEADSDLTDARTAVPALT
ncbi:single-stranded DNA-binding protein [Modestobacter italicus]|uniref:single-stranded DNA-binding protein n=1 Tax=Modestobacter italicus (strain DSM 44449 / CECT 9708 / BC 501) TaxID=2732864 RepID=UPI001C94A6DB|nr:single-stranded DNA-binding protein [Modestobacter italicus]